MYACLYVPDFPVQALLLPEAAETRTTLKQTPLAILDGPANLPKVFATNHAARCAGIQPGMTKLQVETLGGILLRKRSQEAEETAQLKLTEFAGTFSPRVESTCAGAAILDLAGTGKLFGPASDIAGMMTANAAEIGFDLRVAIASNPDTAFLASKGFSANTFLPAGEEAARLADLPMNVLPISPEMLKALDGWGIRTLQPLAMLPAVAVVERLGQEGLHLQKLAQGQVSRPLLTLDPSAEFVASFEFEDPVEGLESLVLVLDHLLQRLCSNLMSAALATTELRLTIELEVLNAERGKQRELYRHEWKLPVPTQEKHLLFGLARLYLEKTTFSAPVRKLIAQLEPVKPRVAQGHLFAPPSPEPVKLELTLDRIRGVVGATDADGIACVGSPRLPDTHAPGSFTIERFSGNESAKALTAAPIIVFRSFRPPIGTAVELDHGRPHFVRLWRRQRRVLAASGPWINSGNWWNASAWKREEWDVALHTPEGTGFYRIYRDRIRRQWFVEGVFD